MSENYYVDSADKATIRAQRLGKPRGSVWRDARGRRTGPGSLKAVRATTADGKLWDVSRFPFVELKRKCRVPSHESNNSALETVVAALLTPTIKTMRQAGIARLSIERDCSFLLQMEDGTVLGPIRVPEAFTI